MRFIQTFSTSGAVQEAVIENRLGKPYVAYIEDENKLDWNTKAPLPPEPIYSAMPLTFEIISGGTINLKATNSYGVKTVILEYQKNNNEWIPFTSSTGGYDIVVEPGDEVRFRGDNDSMCEKPYLAFADDKANRFKDSTAVYNIYGNIMSLLSKTGYTEMSALTSDYAFAHLFQDCLGLISAQNLVLPAVTLRSHCYKCMFQASTNLLYGPKVLNFSTPSNWCCLQMFKNCTSMVSAPELLASNINIDRCYGGIFQGCANLNRIVCMALNPFENNCLQGWVIDVSSTGTFVKNPSASWTTGQSGIPDGWTVIDAS